MTQYHGIDPNGVAGGISPPNGNHYGIFGESNDSNSPVPNFGVGVVGTSTFGDGGWVAGSDFGLYAQTLGQSSTPWAVFANGSVPNGIGTVGWGEYVGVWGDGGNGRGGWFTNGPENFYPALEAQGNSLGPGAWVTNTSVILPALFAQNDTNNGLAVYGEADTGTGVLGVSRNLYGVVGQSIRGTGVYGYTGNVDGYAGYFAGNVFVSGTLNKSALAFMIDHPLDPENKYLCHWR
jgi:hypothetical protein